MLHADDCPGLEPDKDPNLHLIKAPVEIRLRIDLNDESLSPAFRRSGTSLTETLQNLVDLQQSRWDVTEILKDLANHSIDDARLLRTVIGSVAKNGTAQDHALVLGALVSEQEVPAGRKLAAVFLLSTVEQRSADPQYAVAFAEALRDVPSESLFKLLSLGLSGDVQAQIADSIFSNKLNDAVQTIQDPVTRAKYSAEGLSDRERIAAVEHVSSEVRVGLLRELVALSVNSPEVRDELAGKLDNILFFSPSAERITIVRDLLPHAAGELGGLVHEVIGGILRSSGSVQQLAEVIESSGKEALLNLRSVEVTNLVAHADLYQQIKAVPLPERLDAQATREEVLAGIQELQKFFKTIEQIVLTSPYTETMIAREYYAIALNGHGVAGFDRDTITSLDELRSSTNANIAAAAVEIEFGVNLTNTYEVFQTPDGQMLPGNHAKWSEREIQLIKEVFESLPPGYAHFTPLVHTLEKRHSLSEVGAPEGALGARYFDGTIRIGADAIDNEGFKRRMGGVDSLKIVLTHEIGHSIQFGGRSADSRTTTAPEMLEHVKGDPRIEFDDYMELSRWQIISPDRYSYEHGGQAIKLDGKFYPLNVPVKVEDERIFFMRYGNHLFAYSTDSKFSLRNYARTSPNEDWAEAFAEYILLPERLINFAPEKFKFLEEEFRVYKENSQILSQLTERLSR